MSQYPSEHYLDTGMCKCLLKYCNTAIDVTEVSGFTGEGNSKNSKIHKKKNIDMKLALGVCKLGLDRLRVGLGLI